MPIYYVGMRESNTSRYVATENLDKLRVFCALEGYDYLVELSEHAALYFNDPAKRHFVIWLDEEG